MKFFCSYRMCVLFSTILWLCFFSFGCKAAETQVGKILFKSETINIDKDYAIDAETGTLDVAENRKIAEGKKIRLFIIRLKSTSPNPGAPVIYLAGGPGASGSSVLKTERLIILETLRAYSDVYIFDQRGTGATQPVMTSAKPLGLPLDKPLDSPESLAAYYDKMKRMADEAKENSIDINAYNTLENAADVNDLRIALGAKKIILWRHSYGSHLALAIIKQHGQFVEKAILSGVNGLNQRFRLPTDVNIVFREMDQLISLKPKLRKQIPSLALLVKQELDKLDKKPVTTTIEVNNEEVKVTLGRTDVEVATALNAGSISFIQELPQLFYNMSQNNYSAMGMHIYKTIKQRPEGTPMSYSMHYASGASNERLMTISKTQSDGLLRNAINFPFNTKELQNIWPVTDLGEDFRQPFRSDVPVLLLSGNLDGRTSVTDAQEVGKQFLSKTHIIFKNASHDLLAPQLISVMEKFIAGRPQKDSVYEVAGFNFYALNSLEFIQRSTAMLFAEGMNGIEKFKEYYSRFSNDTNNLITPTQILPTVYQLFNFKKPEVALEALKIHKQLFREENWQIENAFGDAYLELGDKEQALKYYLRSLQLNPLNFRAYKLVNRMK